MYMFTLDLLENTIGCSLWLEWAPLEHIIDLLKSFNASLAEFIQEGRQTFY